MAIPFAALGRPKRGIVRIPPGGHPAPAEVAPAPQVAETVVEAPVDVVEAPVEEPTPAPVEVPPAVEVPVVEAADVAEPSEPVEEPVSEPESSTPDLSGMPKVNSGSSKTDMLAAAAYLNLEVSSANTRAEIWSAIQAAIGV